MLIAHHGDDGTLQVYDSVETLVREREALDVEDCLRAVFDETGRRYRIRWIEPNRESRWFLGIRSVENGRYTLEAAERDPEALLALLRDASIHREERDVDALEALTRRLASVSR